MAALLLAQRQQVTHLRGFLVGQRGCENSSPAVLSQTDEDNTAFSHRRTASWNSQRHSPARVREGDHQNSDFNIYSCAYFKMWCIALQTY